ADPLANRGERPRDRFARDQIELDRRGLAALLDDGLLQCRGIGGIARGQDDEEPFPGERLGDGPADAPAHADRDVAVVEGLAVRLLGVAPVGLPFGGGSDPHRDLLPGRAHAVLLTRRYGLLAALVTRQAA